MLSMALLDEPLSRYSVSIQSMNQWLLIRFRGVTMLFLFVVTSSLALWGLCAPAWQRHHLLRWRKTEMGRQELGEGDRWEGPSRLFLVVPCCVAFHCAVVCRRKCKHLCFHISIFACLWPCDTKAFVVVEHNLLNMYQQRVCVCGLKWNLIIFFSACLFLDVSASISPYFVPATPLYSAEGSRN